MKGVRPTAELNPKSDPPHGRSAGNHHTIMIDECPRCNGEGRDLGAPSKWGDGSPSDHGPCRTCGGSGEVWTEFECRTLEDLDEEDAERAEGLQVPQPEATSHDPNNPLKHAAEISGDVP